MACEDVQSLEHVSVFVGELLFLEDVELSELVSFIDERGVDELYEMSGDWIRFVDYQGADHLLAGSS